MTSYYGNENEPSKDPITPEQLLGLFQRRLYPMYPFMEQDMTKSSLFEWQRCLENYSEHQVDVAISKWLRSKAGAKKNPMPGDLIELIPYQAAKSDKKTIGNGIGWRYWGLFQWRDKLDDNKKPTGKQQLIEISTVFMDESKSVDDASKYFQRHVQNYFDQDSLSGYIVKFICNGEDLFKDNKEEQN